MPKFTTISPTHIAGQKPNAWERFPAGHYVQGASRGHPLFDLPLKDAEPCERV